MQSNDQVVFRLLRRDDLQQLKGPLQELFIFGNDVELQHLLEDTERWYCLAAATSGAESRVLGFVAAAVGQVSEFPQDSSLLAAAIERERLSSNSNSSSGSSSGGSTGANRSSSTTKNGTAAAGSIDALSASPAGDDLVTAVVLLGVLKEWRRRRIATRLLRRVREFARSRQCATMCLHVQASNAPAISLYEQQGFRLAGTLPGYYDQQAAAPNASRDALLYVQPLQLEPRGAAAPKAAAAAAAAMPSGASGVSSALGGRGTWLGGGRLRRRAEDELADYAAGAGLAAWPSAAALPTTGAGPGSDGGNSSMLSSGSSAGSLGSSVSSDPPTQRRAHEVLVNRDGDGASSSSSSQLEPVPSVLDAVAGVLVRLLFGTPGRRQQRPQIRRDVVELGAGEKVAVVRAEDGEVYITDPDLEEPSAVDRDTAPWNGGDDSGSGSGGGGGSGSNSSADRGLAAGDSSRGGEGAGATAAPSSSSRSGVPFSSLPLGAVLHRSNTRGITAPSAPGWWRDSSPTRRHRPRTVAAAALHTPSGMSRHLQMRGAGLQMTALKQAARIRLQAYARLPGRPAGHMPGAHV